MTPAEYKAARLATGLTQAELAALLGLPREAIVRREAGQQRITREAEMALRGLKKKSPATPATTPDRVV